MISSTSTAHPNETSQSAPRPRLAYLLSIYPAISHTFFLNEIVALRKLGFSIDVASINRSEQAAGPVSEVEAAEQKTTFHLKTLGLGQVAAAMMAILCRHPQVAFRGLRAALSLDAGNLPASARSLLYLAEALLLGHWLRKRGHTHLHIHFGGPVATVGLLASAAWNISYSITLHGPEEFYNVQKFHLKRKVENASFVFCISDYCQSQVMKLCHPSHWKKLHVVRLGVDLNSFAPAARVDRKGPLEILCVGRLVPDKGHQILLSAFASLRRQGHDIRLRLIGNGTERDTLESFVAQEELTDAVLFEGALAHEATRQKLARADIFVLASFAEGLPVALMEAMAMGIPCISTFVAAIPELISDGVDGLLVPPSSERALSAALERLILSDDLRRQFAAAGRQRVCASYDLSRNVRLLADTFENCLAGLPEPGTTLSK
jgi:colanic acid/amylovoran biosynthesis glycosyltransferase